MKGQWWFCVGPKRSIVRAPHAGNRQGFDSTSEPQVKTVAELAVSQ